MDLDILILGPVELHVNGRREMHGSTKALHMLATLALDAGRSVPLSRLADHLWEEAPPGKPDSSLHSYAARLRRVLGAGRLRYQAHAYALDVDPQSVDHHRFLRLTAQARSLARSGDDGQALVLLQQADQLWRGEPLTGFNGLWAAQVRRDLVARHLAATLLRVELELRMSRFAGLVGELASLLEQWPTDETVVGYFMTAAYGCGRQTDALRAYDTLRTLLRQEGTEPGEALTRTYRCILDGAPVGDLLPGRAPGTPASVPDNLPAHAQLVGRAAELQALRTQAPGAVVFHALSGMAGVGKSLLALHAARGLAQQYPEARLYINLYGHSASQKPLPPETAITTLLRQLGVSASAIPHSLEDLVTMWRTVLSHRRAVIILDDAAGPEQIRPLLAGNSASLLLVTSRRRLGGIPGIRHVFLDVLSTKESVDLFTGLVGRGRAADPAEVAEIARLCGHLPLALELAAGRLNSRPSWSVSHLVERLSQGAGRLAEIRDGETEIATPFGLSYDTLSDSQQRVFRLLSLHFGHDFGPHATAALVGLPLAETEKILEFLLDSHLANEPAPDRYQLHDLIAEFSHNLRASKDGEGVAETALDRLCDFYLHAAAEADRLLQPRRSRLEPPAAPPPLALPAWSGAEAARNWLTAERPALVAAERHLRDHGHPARAARLSHVVAAFLDTDGYWQAAELHEHATKHWHTASDSTAEAYALLDLTTVQYRTGQYDMADHNGHRALRLARAVGDVPLKAESLRLLGLLYLDQGRLDEALGYLHEALEVRSTLGDPWHIARCQNNLGIVQVELGNHTGALHSFRAALFGFVGAKDQRGEAQALNNLGHLHLQKGEIESAHKAFARSLNIVLRVGSRTEQAVAQLNMASTLHVPEDPDRPLDLLRQALSAFRQVHDKRGEASALNLIGAGLYNTGHFVEALAHHSAALDLARRMGAAQEETQALLGAAKAELRAGRTSVGHAQLLAALSTAQRIHAAEEAARCQTALAEFHLKAGQRDQALTHLRDALSYFQGRNGSESQRLRTLMSELDRNAMLRG